MRDVRQLLAEAVRVGDPAGLAEMTPEQALEAVEVLALLRVTVAERARGGANPGRVEVGAGTWAPDRLLTAQEVAEECGCSVAWVYRQAPRWLFTRKLSHRVLRFSEKGLREWVTKGRRR